MDAVKDLSTAHEVDPGSAEIAKQLAAARAGYEECRAEKELERGLRKAGEGKSGSVEGTDFAVLREVEAGAYTRALFSSTWSVSVTHDDQRIIQLNKRGSKHIGG